MHEQFLQVKWTVGLNLVYLFTHVFEFSG